MTTKNNVNKFDDEVIYTLLYFRINFTSKNKMSKTVKYLGWIQLQDRMTVLEFRKPDGNAKRAVQQTSQSKTPRMSTSMLDMDEEIIPGVKKRMEKSRPGTITHEGLMVRERDYIRRVLAGSESTIEDIIEELHKLIDPKRRDIRD